MNNINLHIFFLFNIAENEQWHFSVNLIFNSDMIWLYCNAIRIYFYMRACCEGKKLFRVSLIVNNMDCTILLNFTFHSVIPWIYCLHFIEPFQWNWFNFFPQHFIFTSIFLIFGCIFCIVFQLQLDLAVFERFKKPKPQNLPN